jgi:tetratricopeptide (TPR) repeat protein
LRSRLSELALIVVALSAWPAGAHGGDGDEREVAAARAEYVRAAELARKAQWAEALAAFERSAQIKPHPATTYNMGACQRALGQYTRARKMYLQALAENEAAGGGQIPETTANDARAIVRDLDRIFARAEVSLEPADVEVTVDGRPLEPMGKAGTFVAGTRDPGPAEIAPAPSFTLVLDPGPHVLIVGRKGWKPIAVNRTFDAGSVTPLPLALARLDATCTWKRSAIKPS